MHACINSLEMLITGTKNPVHKYMSNMLGKREEKKTLSKFKISFTETQNINFSITMAGCKFKNKIKLLTFSRLPMSTNMSIKRYFSANI